MVVNQWVSKTTQVSTARASKWAFRRRYPSTSVVSRPPLFGAGALWFEEIAWEAVGVGPIAGLLYQGVVIAGVGFTVSYHLIRRYTPSVMMSFNFVSPIAGVLFSAWLLGDRVGTLLLAGMALVAVGLYVVARQPRAAR